MRNILLCRELHTGEISTLIRKSPSNSHGVPPCCLRACLTQKSHFQTPFGRRYLTGAIAATRCRKGNDSTWHRSRQRCLSPCATRREKHVISQVATVTHRCDSAPSTLPPNQSPARICSDEVRLAILSGVTCDGLSWRDPRLVNRSHVSMFTVEFTHYAIERSSWGIFDSCCSGRFRFTEEASSGALSHVDLTKGY